MENFIILILISLLAESVWETLKMIWQNGKLVIDRVGALVVSVLIAIGTNLDILSLLGVKTFIPYLGVILTGILISRGSNFIHDLLVRVGNIKINEEKGGK